MASQEKKQVKNVTSSANNQPVQTKEKQEKKVTTQDKAKQPKMSKQAAIMAQLPPEIAAQVEALIAAKDAEAEEAKKQALAAKKTKEGKQAIEFKLLDPTPDQLLPNGNMEVVLGSIKLMSETPIQYGKEATRELNEFQRDVYKGAMAKGDVFPVPHVKLTTHGPMLVSGRHRVSAMTELLRDQFRHPVTEEISAQDVLRFEKALHTEKIEVKPIMNMSPLQLYFYSVEENDKSALPLGKGARTRAAIIAHQTSPMVPDEQHPGSMRHEITIRAAARLYKIHHSAIVQQLQRDAVKQDVPVEKLVDPGDKEEVAKLAEEQDNKEASDKAILALKKILSGIHYVGNEVDDARQIAHGLRENASTTLKDDYQAILRVENALRYLRDIIDKETPGSYEQKQLPPAKPETATATATATATDKK